LVQQRGEGRDLYSDVADIYRNYIDTDYENDGNCTIRIYGNFDRRQIRIEFASGSVSLIQLIHNNFYPEEFVWRRKPTRNEKKRKT
jgi:hypothetical protein